VEEITIKKTKMMANLLTVADVCIEASEAQARLLESRNKGSPRKKQQDDREVNTADHGDHGNRENHQQQPAEQKEKMLFRRPDDVEKWYEIHRTVRHDLEECKTFLDRKKMPAPQVAQEPHRGEHRQANTNNEDQIDKINEILAAAYLSPQRHMGKRLKEKSA
jgi:Ni/Co efflux regulator RcnB